jgi:multiple antibiotic resistance protein
MKDQIGSLLPHAATVFMGFFAIMNPIANTSIFLGLTAGDDAATKRQVARNALLLTFVIIVIVAVMGKLLFQLFGITLPAFRITGGILIFFIGVQMLQGAHSSVHKPSDSDLQKSRDAKLAIAVSPLAIPILAGPGTIATAMNFASASGITTLLITVGAFAILCLITYISFVSGERMIKYLGENAVNAITRLMGLILATIGTQMVIAGVSELLSPAHG